MTQKEIDLTQAYLRKAQRVITWSGLPVNELYNPADLKGSDYEKDIADSGEYPFTRGIYRNMYRGRLWTMRQITGFGLPSETNERFKFEIDAGASGLDVNLDQPTHNAIDPDHPLAVGQPGRLGAAMATLLEMEQMMEGIPGDKTSIVFDTSTAAFIPVVLAQYLIANEKKGIDKSQLRLTIQNDPLHLRYCGYAIANPIDICMKINADLVEYVVRNNIRCDNQVNLYDQREFGVNAYQEIAFGFSNAIAYIEEALKRGLTIDEIAPRRAFVCSVHIDFFEEICKFRAARRMWARIMKERYGAQNPRSWLFRFGARTSGYSLPAQQVKNNIMRVAFETLAGVLGGAQAVVPACYDEPVAIPTEESHMLALRTQQIIAYELGVTSVADPLGGSYYVESLTSKIEEEAWKIIKEIEDMGGSPEAIRRGWFDREIDRADLQINREIESGERIIVGVNAFTIEEKETPMEFHKYNPGTERILVEQIRETRRRRDNEKVREALVKIRAQAEESKKGNEINLVPAIIDAVRLYATLGEIGGMIRQGYGYTYDPFEKIGAPF